MEISPQEIRAGPVEALERLIEVPIGTIEASSTVTVTIGFDKSHFNTPGVDADPIFAITDGVVGYSVWIVDIINYPTSAPCYSTSNQNKNNLLSAGTKFPSTFKITFHVGEQYGYCETAQEGGYLNTFTEDQPMDLSKPLNLDQ